MTKFYEFVTEKEQKFGVTPKSANDNYGQELILDLHHCDISKFNRENLETYIKNICTMANMERAMLHWWDYQDSPQQKEYDIKNAPNLVGTSAVQFIKTSTVVIHTLELWKKVFINFFTCRTFSAEKVKNYTEKFFGGKVVTYYNIVRK
jgi:S-adenosylmethionine/arginine decarboxylase-like enzyme